MDLNSAIKSSFSKVLKKYRTETKISQKELSERSGLHRNEIGMLEREKRAPSLETIIKISNGLNLAPQVIINSFFDVLYSETEKMSE